MKIILIILFLIIPSSFSKADVVLDNSLWTNTVIITSVASGGGAIVYVIDDSGNTVSDDAANFVTF